jgi:nitrate reductase assembly molybdenum cofactor insertion protein NarJ
MSTTLKKNFLKLLDKDMEFRYAVAGYLGLSEILKRLEIHDKKFNEIFERLKTHDEKFNEILKLLNEHTIRLGEHDKKFNEIMERLEIHDKKFNEIFERLEEHDKKFNEIIEILRKHSKDLSDIRAYIERTSLTLEEEAREVLTEKLKNLGIDIKLSSLILPDIEINIYGVKDDFCVIGETSTRAGVRVVSLVDENIDILKEKYSEYLRKKIIKVVYTMWVTKAAIEEAKKRNIWLVKATEELTPLIF